MSMRRRSRSGRLHEFLTYDTEQPTAESYELCAVYA